MWYIIYSKAIVIGNVVWDTVCDTKLFNLPDYGIFLAEQYIQKLNRLEYSK